MRKSQAKVKGYDPSTPIFVEDSRGRIFKLEEHPQRSVDWNTIQNVMDVAFCIIPEIEEANFSKAELDALQQAFQETGDKNVAQRKRKISMSPIREGTSMEKIYMSIDDR